MVSERQSETPSLYWREEILDESILHLRFERPPENRLTAEALTELSKLTDRTEANPTLKCLVISSGVEGYFIGDTEDVEWERIAQASSPQSELVPWHRACSRLASYPLPTIAAIDGKTAGSGLELSLCTDVRIAGAGAEFDFSFLRRGTIPSSGGTQRLPRLVGKPMALQLLASAASLDADQAVKCGLVQQASTKTAVEEALSLAKAIASYDRQVLAALKTAIGGSDVPLAEGLALEARLAASLMTAAGRHVASETGSGDPPDR
jgi:enoyl-CoA hydratase/carnithine racemase